MGDQKLISIDLRADFAFFKKPDYNDGLLLSYNIMHKPALLGILGAIIGLAGYQKKGELPEYYQKLKDLPVGVEPLGAEKGNFQKTSVKYTNTVGYANDDGNLIVDETMLIKPCYRCYLLLDTAISEHALLYENLSRGYAEFIPYLGKNEFQASWMDSGGENTFREYIFLPRANPERDYKIKTLFRKTVVVNDSTDTESVDTYSPYKLALTAETFVYFERLPFSFVNHPVMIQYLMESYAYSNLTIKKEVVLEGLYFIKELEAYVQLA